MKCSKILLCVCLLFFSISSNGEIKGIKIDETHELYNIINSQKKPSNAAIIGKSVSLCGWWRKRLLLNWGLWHRGNGHILGNVRIEKSKITVYYTDDIDSEKILWFSQDVSKIEDPASDFIVTDGTKIIVDLKTSSKTIGLSELSKHSTVLNTEAPSKNIGLSVVAENGAKFTDCRLDGIKYLECYGPFSQFKNVTIDNSYMGMYNHGGGRIDRYSISIPSTSSSWLSRLSAGSSFWDWNPVDMDPTKIYFESETSSYQYGYTASYQFVDLETDKLVEGQNIWYVDNRTGKRKLIGHYTTNANGVLQGNIDSRTGRLESFENRPSLYVLTHQSKALEVDPTDNCKYEIKKITPELHVRSYRHKQVDPSFPINGEIGKIDADKNVVSYAKYFLRKDIRVTEEDYKKVRNYKMIHNSNELYDYLKYLWSIDLANPRIEITGSTLNIPQGWNLKIDRGIKKAVKIDTKRHIIKVKADRIEPTENINVIENDSGLIYSASNEYIAMPYLDSTCNSYTTVINLNPEDSVAVYDSSWKLKYSGTGVYGFPYLQHPTSEYFVSIYKANGTIATKKCKLNKGGLKNKFVMVFNPGAGEFKKSDRIKMYEIPDLLRSNAEKHSELLNEVNTWVHQLQLQLKRGY